MLLTSTLRTSIAEICACATSLRYSRATMMHRTFLLLMRNNHSEQLNRVCLNLTTQKPFQLVAYGSAKTLPLMATTRDLIVAPNNCGRMPTSTLNRKLINPHLPVGCYKYCSSVAGDSRASYKTHSIASKLGKKP